MIDGPAKSIGRKRRRQTGQWYAKLEPRNLLANFIVNTSLDDGGTTNDGLISLREAVIAANTNAPFGDAPAGDALGDFISFDSSLDGQTIEMSQGTIPVSENLSIRANGIEITIQSEDDKWVFEVETDEQVKLTGLTFLGAEEAFMEGGGGVKMSGGGTLRLTNTSFTRLGASGNDLRAVSAQDSALHVVNSTFQSNYSLTGGAMRIDGGVTNIVGSYFESNYVESSGGALFLSGGEHYISDTEFRGNSATSPAGFGQTFGGAINITGSASVQIFDGQFVGNLAGRGGAVHSSAELSIWGDSAFSSNRAIGARDTTVFNADGGAIFASGQLRLVDTLIESNEAQKGAGIYLSRESSALFNRVNVLENEASISGGGVYIINGNSRLIDSTFERNTAGGNVVVDDGFNLSRQFLGDGGGIFFTSQRESSVLEINGGSISNNISEINGGGLFVSALGSSPNAYVRIYNATLISNNQTNRIHDPEDPQEPKGGGIYSSATLLQINDAVIRGNQSTGYGGGIHVQSGLARIDNSSIASNRAMWDGGGVNIMGGNVRLFRSEVGGENPEDGNLAGQFTADGTRGFGGGVNVTNDTGDSRFFMIGGMIRNNAAKIRGGGISISGQGNVVRTQNNAAITMNRALVTDGGGIYNDDAHLELRDSVFADNSSRNGGGIYQKTGTTNLIRTSVENNEARRTAGGIFFRGRLKQVDGLIENNLATFFPNVYNGN